MSQPYKVGDQVVYLGEWSGGLTAQAADVEEIDDNEILIRIYDIDIVDGYDFAAIRTEWHHVDAQGIGDFVLPMNEEIHTQILATENSQLLLSPTDAELNDFMNEVSYNDGYDFEEGDGYDQQL